MTQASAPYTPPASRPDPPKRPPPSNSAPDASKSGKKDKSGKKSKSGGKEKSGAALAGWALRIVFIGLVIFGLAFVIGLNFQPWLAVGEQVAMLITDNPVVWAVQWIPVFGSVFQWLLVEAANVAKTAAFIAWGISQFTQVFPMVARYLKRKGFIRKGLTTKFQIIRVCSYVVEVIVAFMAYPPYIGGYGALMADFSADVLDHSLIDGWNIVTAIVTIALFEAYCAVCIEVWRIISD